MCKSCVCFGSCMQDILSFLISNKIWPCDIHMVPHSYQSVLYFALFLSPIRLFQVELFDTWMYVIMLIFGVRNNFSN